MHINMKRGLIFCAALIVGGSIGLYWKGEPLVKHVVKTALVNSLAPLGIHEVEMSSLRFGWGRLYLRNIQSKPTPSHASLVIQEMDIALSIFFKMKAIDIVGATLNLQETGADSYSVKEWEERHEKAIETIRYLKTLKLPDVSIRDSQVVIPSHAGSLTLPVQMVTHTTVSKNQIMTLDIGEPAADKFSGQVVLDSGKDGLSLDVHTVNIDLETPHFRLRAPEISFYGSSATGEEEGYVLQGFARINALKLKHFGTLLMPVEINLEGAGMPENFNIEQLDISGGANKASQATFELNGTVKPFEGAAELSVAMSIAKLQQIWDFTPLFITKPDEKIELQGQVTLEGDLVWKEGQITSPHLKASLQAGNFRRNKVSLEDISSTLTLTGVYPLVTKGLQHLSIKSVALKAGDFKDIHASFQLNKNSDLLIQEVTAAAFGGILKAYQFKRQPSKKQTAYEFLTDLHHVELAELLKLMQMKTLSGEAKLEGILGLRYEIGEGLDLKTASIHSISEIGILRYQPLGALPDNNPIEKSLLDMGADELVFQTLADLHFKVLKIDVSPDPANAEEWEGIVKIQGFNPKVLNGYPFEFNITTNGKLKDLIVNTVKNMKPSKSVKKLIGK